jgi:hypothetical protein
MLKRVGAACAVIACAALVAARHPPIAAKGSPCKVAVGRTFDVASCP